MSLSWTLRSPGILRFSAPGQEGTLYAWPPMGKHFPLPSLLSLLNRSPFAPVSQFLLKTIEILPSFWSWHPTCTYASRNTWIIQPDQRGYNNGSHIYIYMRLRHPEEDQQSLGPREGHAFRRRFHALGLEYGAEQGHRCPLRRRLRHGVAQPLAWRMETIRCCRHGNRAGNGDGLKRFS